jgi:biotin transport system substrate-specific component
VAGVPWFAGHASGYTSATIPSFGFIIGFFFAAAVCGYLAEHGADRTITGSVPAMIAGEIMIYLFGVTWLAVDLHVGAAKALSLGFTPFVIGDAIKAAIAAGLLPAAWKLAGRGRSGAPRPGESRPDDVV